LAEGGKDTVENAAALCPNCHKEAHFGENKECIKKSYSISKHYKYSTLMSGINIDNFEDGQYDADDSMYTDEDNAFLEEVMVKAMRRENDNEEEE